MLVIVFSASTFFTNLTLHGSGISYAERDYLAEMEERKLLPIESNQIAGWPQGPAIGAKCAILMEMNTHTILYAKNIHEKMYPASTTKILTCLLAMQNCSLDEEITFSHAAIYNVPTDGSKLGGVDEGDKLSMEHALYSVLVKSANEVASAVGEHVAESLGKEKTEEAFAEIMNEKAKSLGCLNSHFVNANGLFDENHYTSAYDLGLIGCEFFGNELLCKMSSTPSYHFRLHETDDDDAWISSKNLLYKGKAYAYQYLLGSKTGYVNQSHQTLVSAAEKNGMKLVCVILYEESPYQFEDTVSLFQYGFENFQRLSINEHEEKYKIDNTDLFYTENDLFGNSTPLISMEEDKYVILPNTAEFSDAISTLTYRSSTEEEPPDSNVIASINYSYSGTDVGSCNIIFSKREAQPAAEPDDPVPALSEETPDLYVEASTPDDGTSGQNIVFINIKKVIIGLLIAAAAGTLITFLISTVSSYSFSPRGQSGKRRRQRRREKRIAKKHARQRASMLKNQLRRKKGGWKN